MQIVVSSILNLFQLRLECGPFKDPTSTGVVMKLRDSDLMKVLEGLGKYGNHIDVVFRSAISSILFKKFDESSDSAEYGILIIQEMRDFLNKRMSTVIQQRRNSSDSKWETVQIELTDVLNALRKYETLFYSNLIKLLKDSRAEVFSNWKKIIDLKPKYIVLHSLDVFEISSNIFSESDYERVDGHGWIKRQRTKISADACLFGIVS